MADDPAPTVDNTPTAPTPAPAAEPAVTPSPAPTETGDQPAPSPSATPEVDQGNTREALLAHVQKAVPEPRSSPDDKKGEVAGGVSPAPDAKSPDPSSPPRPDDDAELSDDPVPEELAAYRGHAKRRVEKLLGQRNEARKEVERLKGIEPQAKAAESVTKYLRDNDIARDDFLLTLELAAAMRRGDFKTFYEGVRPYMQLAEEYLGIALPRDLQQAVEQGQMTSQSARLFSRERMDRALAESQRVRQAQLYDSNTAAVAQTNLANAVATEVNKWEQATMAADPDYAAKKAAVQDTMWAVVREKGAPQSADHAVAIAQEAYRRVNERYRSWTPPRRPTSPQPRSTGRTNGAAPEAKTLKEAVAQAVERARV